MEKSLKAKQIDEGGSDLPIVVGIGASAGGIQALQSFFKELPAKTGMAYVVVVHLSPEHESYLADLLQKNSSIPIVQVTDQVEVKKDHAYIIPPNKNLTIENQILHLTKRTSKKGVQSPIDIFLQSLAESYKERAVSVILSGTGNDGTNGTLKIKEFGGLTIAQLPDEAEYDDMPLNAISTGHVDITSPVLEMVNELRDYGIKRGNFPYFRQAEELTDEENEIYLNILDLVKKQSGNTFTQYKRPTILRRISRRILLSESADLSSYYSFLQNDEEEVKKLYKDFLLTVTSFFRDKKTFDELEKTIIPEIFNRKDYNEPIRVWCAGCATGEEAYSLAILLNEQNEKNEQNRELQIFATDISEISLKKARGGVFPKSILSDVNKERINRFFVTDDDDYNVNDELRDTIIFSLHNVLRDPPFAKLDLITCRNLLIYLDRDLQKHVIKLFHYALNPGGYLFLGSSESIDSSDLFEAIDKKKSIYKKTESKLINKGFPRLPFRSSGVKRTFSEPSKRDIRQLPNIEEVHRKFIAPWLPPSVIVNSEYSVEHTLGGGEEYLTFVAGRPTQDIFKVVRKELRFELRSALKTAFNDRNSVRSKPVTVKIEGEPRVVEMLVEPVNDTEFEGDHVHILFLEENMQPRFSVDKVPKRRNKKEKTELIDDEGWPGDLEEAKNVIGQLEEEVANLNDLLYTTTKENETAIEELRAANEEQLSMNEELMSTTEELETSKEELQSMNEELMTLNQELNNKIEESRQINSDLQNLISATEIPTIFLDRKLRIKRYTPPVNKLFSVIESDVGRFISDLNHHLDYDNLITDAEKVYNKAIMLEREAKNKKTKEWYMVRMRPYRSVDDKIEGVVIAFIDITKAKNYEINLKTINLSLDQKVKERTKKVRKLAAELLHAENEERRRIAHMLHEDLQQQLYVLKMDLNHSRDMLDSKANTEFISQLTEWESILKKSLILTKDLALDLSPPFPGDITLNEAVEWLALHMKETYDQDVKLDIKKTIQWPGENLIHMLIQMLRELLFNVVKHAGVDRARIKIDSVKGDLRLNVEDKGSGFDKKINGTFAEVSECYGLKNIRHRIELLGGEFEIDTAPGRGTKIKLSIPTDHPVDSTKQSR